MGFEWLDWIFPPRCPICDTVREKAGCCESCYTRIHFVRQPFCFRCGQPLFDSEQEYCRDCMKHTKTFAGNRAVFRYDDVTKASLSRFKFHNRREYAAFYAGEILRIYGEELLALSLDAVIPVPVHARKKRHRGYNQAALVAKEIAKVLEVEVWEKGLLRVADTLPQKELNNIQRLKNLEKAFKLGENSVKLKRILLIDDIYTTGTTLEACSRVLKQGGALEVYGITVAIGQGDV